MSGRLLDKAREAKLVNEPTVDLAEESREKKRPSRELGLVCLTSTSMALGTFVSVDGDVSIGRGTDVTLQMPQDAALSRKHCTVRKEAGSAFAVSDHQSKNGTFVNGTKVDKARLVKGDLLRAGDALFLVDEPV